MKRIEVIVSPKGENRIETHGYEGSACRAATRELERALGVSRAETLKAEFYEHSTTDVEQKENE